jgi:hypothetical protein
MQTSPYYITGVLLAFHLIIYYMNNCPKQKKRKSNLTEVNLLEKFKINALEIIHLQKRKSSLIYCFNSRAS